MTVYVTFLPNFLLMQAKMSQLLGWMQEEGLQPEIVSFSDPTVSWMDYSLIIPTCFLVYLDFYQPVMEVKRMGMGIRIMFLICSGLS